MSKNKKLSAYPDRQANLKGTSFTSKKLKRTWKERTRTFLWYVIVFGIAFNTLSTTLLTRDIELPSFEGIKPVEAQIEPNLTISEHICQATNGENCDVLYNLCMAESNCEKYAINKNTNGTYDYSYFQINDVHIIGKKASKGKGTITMDCVYDLYCVSKWSNEKVKEGKLHIWVASKKI